MQIRMLSVYMTQPLNHLNSSLLRIPSASSLTKAPNTWVANAFFMTLTIESNGLADLRKYCDKHRRTTSAKPSFHQLQQWHGPSWKLRDVLDGHPWSLKWSDFLSQFSSSIRKRLLIHQMSDSKTSTSNFGNHFPLFPFLDKQIAVANQCDKIASEPWKASWRRILLAMLPSHCQLFPCCNLHKSWNHAI